MGSFCVEISHRFTNMSSLGYEGSYNMLHENSFSVKFEFGFGIQQRHGACVSPAAIDSKGVSKWACKQQCTVHFKIMLEINTWNGNVMWFHLVSGEKETDMRSLHGQIAYIGESREARTGACWFSNGDARTYPDSIPYVHWGQIRQFTDDLWNVPTHFTLEFSELLLSNVCYHPATVGTLNENPTFCWLSGEDMCTSRQPIIS